MIGDAVAILTDFQSYLGFYSLPDLAGIPAFQAVQIGTRNALPPTHFDLRPIILAHLPPGTALRFRKRAWHIQPLIQILSRPLLRFVLVMRLARSRLGLAWRFASLAFAMPLYRLAAGPLHDACVG